MLKDRLNGPYRVRVGFDAGALLYFQRGSAHAAESLRRSVGVSALTALRRIRIGHCFDDADALARLPIFPWRRIAHGRGYFGSDAWVALQFAQKLFNGLFAFLRRTGEVDLSPPPQVASQGWVQQRIQLRI